MQEGKHTNVTAHSTVYGKASASEYCELFTHKTLRDARHSLYRTLGQLMSVQCELLNCVNFPGCELDFFLG